MGILSPKNSEDFVRRVEAEWEREFGKEAMSDIHGTRQELVQTIEQLRNALTESYADNLYNGIHVGVTGNGGKWWSGGMSDAEWFCRQAGIDDDSDPEFTKEELLARVPEIAQKMVAKFK